MKTLLFVLGVALVAGVAVLLMVPSDEEGPPAVAGPTATSVTAEEPASPVALGDADDALGRVPMADGVIADGEYAHSTEAGGVTVHWANDSLVLRVALVSPGSGYVAIGLDPERRMEGANYILGAVRGGRAAVRDDVGTGPVAHEADVDNGGLDNVSEWGGLETDAGTVFEFVIPLDSGDAMDKPLLPGETYTILVAYHETSDDFAARHTARADAAIELDPAP